MKSFSISRHRLSVTYQGIGLRLDEWRRSLRIATGYAMRPALNRWRFVAVTGSCGKTTTTGLTAYLVDAPSPQLLTYGRNNANGAAQAFFRLIGRRPATAVFEVSGHAPGAIRHTTSLIRPKVGIVTVVGLDHTTAFGPIEATADEKMSLVADLPEDGLAVLNADDPHIMERASVTAARVVTFGKAETATLRLLHVHDRWPDPLTLTLRWRGEEFEVRSPMIGLQSVGVLLASLLAALEMGYDRSLLVQRIAQFEPFMNRMSVHGTPDDRRFVLDAWKAPQWTMNTCLAFLETVQAPRKTVVLGTLSDVRGNTRRRYEETARRALEVADRVLFVGAEAARVRRLVPEAPGRLFMIDHIKDAHHFLQQDRIPDEVIYVKGSRADHLERLLHAAHTDIACWRYRCGKRFQGCSYCSLLLGRQIRDRRRCSTLPWLTEQQRLPV